MSSLNKLDAATKGNKRFSNPEALSSALAVLRTLQPQAFGLLNHLVHLVLAYKIAIEPIKCMLNIKKFGSISDAQITIQDVQKPSFS